MPKWKPIIFLPNVCLGEPVDTEFISLCSSEDERCKAIATEDHGFSIFVSRFTDAFRRKVYPSVIIIREDAPKWLYRLEAVGAFKDSISIAAVTYNKALSLTYGRPKAYTYSTYFDFYAWTLSKQSTLITTNNPAMWGVEESRDFHGQSTPGLSVSRHEKPEFDEPLLTALLGEWRRCYENETPSWRSVALFRSLNMAHSAAQVPAIVEVSNQALGRSVSLWVSAFEILAHPGDRDSGLKEVYSLLDRVDHRHRDLGENKYESYEGRGGRKPHHPLRNLSCWIYGEIYHARNDFMHGNPIEDDRLVVESGRSLFNYPGPLFRLALTSFLGLDLYGPDKPTSDDAVWMQRYEARSKFNLYQAAHERALMTVLEKQ